MYTCLWFFRDQTHHEQRFKVYNCRSGVQDVCEVTSCITRKVFLMRYSYLRKFCKYTHVCRHTFAIIYYLVLLGKHEKVAGSIPDEVTGIFLGG
jgi:hypothetical protein